MSKTRIQTSAVHLFTTYQMLITQEGSQFQNVLLFLYTALKAQDFASELLYQWNFASIKSEGKNLASELLYQWNFASIKSEGKNLENRAILLKYFYWNSKYFWNSSELLLILVKGWFICFLNKWQGLVRASFTFLAF